MIPATETITFGADCSWTFRTEVTRGMRKAFLRAGLSAISGISANGELNGEILTEAVRRAFLANPSSVDVSALDDAFLLHGTVKIVMPERSEENVTLPFIDSLPEAWTERVLVRMTELYAERAGEKKES